MTCLTEWLKNSLSYLCCQSGANRTPNTPNVAPNGTVNGSGNSAQNGTQNGIQNEVSAGTQNVTENAAAVQSGDTGTEAPAAPTSSSSNGERPDQKSNGEHGKPAQAGASTEKVKAPKPKAIKRHKVMPVQVSLDIVEPAPSTGPPAQKRLLCFY